MKDLSRRNFLQLAGVTAAVTSVATWPSRATALPTGFGPLASAFVEITGVEASSERAANPASNVIDGVISDSSRWLSAGDSDPQPTLTLTLAEPAPVRRIVVLSGYLASNSGALDSFRVEAEVDGSWTTVADVSGNTQLALQVGFSPVTTGRLRLVITQGSAVDTIARVFEVYAYTTDVPVPLRQQPKPNLRFTPAGVIANAGYRVSFFEAIWDGGGRAFVHDLDVKVRGQWIPVTAEAERFDDQWAVFSGDRGSSLTYYSTMDVDWVAFDTLRQLDAKTVELSSSTVDAGTFSLTWSLREQRPRLAYRLTVERDGDYLVGYQSFSGRPLDAVDEVFCGPQQHAKVVWDGTQSSATWELTAPFCLTRRTIGDQPVTLGIFLPADELPFEDEHVGRATNQRYAMCLRDDDGLIRPLAFAPDVGDRAALSAGQHHELTFGLLAEPAELTTIYERLLRDEYGYRDYRENVFGQSMTDTMYNLIDLVMTDSGADDSVDFQPSPSGWWNRAKGFADVENPQAVRTTSAGVLLSAYLLTGDDDLYDKRALPTMEFHVSRNGYGWTPKKGFTIYGDDTLYKLGSIPFDASTLSPLYNMTAGWHPAFKELALAKSGAPDDRWLKRTPWSTPLALYRMTGDKSYLSDAEKAATTYIAEEIDTPYTTIVATDFQIYYSRAWTELLELYEATGNRRYLEASRKEARRYITQVFVRPIPEGSITVPVPPVKLHEPAGWEPSAIYPYPRTSMAPEATPAWVVSMNGATFEAWRTYHTAGYTLNPAWAPFLLRLAQHTSDTLLADVAANSIVGRYTNYPGYYNTQFMVDPIKPDYPLQGPANGIYYTHIPVQLGMTIDWLVTEQMVRSGGAIEFPSEFEADYVWFKYHTFGHRPGSFYGDDEVWLWMPKGIVSLDNPQINWITAEGNGNLYLSLTNASDRDQTVTVTFDVARAGMRPERAYSAWVTRDNGGRRPAVVSGGRLRTSVSAKGITAVVVEGVDLDVALHHPVTATSGQRSFHFDDDSSVGIVRGMLLVKPDLSRYDAYVQADTESAATLHYSTDGGATYAVVEDKVYPNEWTVPVPDLAAEFRYFVEADVPPPSIDIAAAEASSERSGYPASNVIDGVISNASRWLSGTSDSQPTLTLTFNAPTSVGRLVVSSGNTVSGDAYQSGSALNSFGVEAEVDGAWTRVADVTGNDQLTVQVVFDPVTTQRVRLVITKGSSRDTIARVYEVSAYATEGPITVRTDEAILSLDGD